MRLTRCKECMYGQKYGVADIVACKLHSFTSNGDGFCHDGIYDMYSVENSEIIDELEEFAGEGDHTENSAT